MTGDSEANSQTQSAVGRALAQLDPKKRRPDPITPELLAKLGAITGWRVLVEPYVPQYQGAVAVTESVDQAEMVICKVGRVLQLGNMAFRARTESGLELAEFNPQPKVGEYWLFEMYAGQEITLRTGHKLRMLADTELLMRVDDPSLIKGYL